jgi:hypothetical protein
MGRPGTQPVTTMPLVRTSESRTLECRISRGTIYPAPRRSWQAPPPGIDKPLISLASTSPSPPGPRQAPRLPLRAVSNIHSSDPLPAGPFGTRGDSALSPNMAAGPDHTSIGAATARGLPQRDEQGGRSMSANPAALRWEYHRF